MKCPKCQNEIRGNAKFCTKCGCNLAEAMAKQTAEPVQQIQKPVCSKCGAPLMPGAGFCTKCGTPVSASKPTTPVAPAEAVKPATPVTPAEASKPTAPVAPAEAVKPTAPVAPAEAVKPTTPVAPAEAVKPTTPVTLAESAPVTLTKQAESAPQSAPAPVSAAPTASQPTPAPQVVATPSASQFGNNMGVDNGRAVHNNNAGNGVNGTGNQYGNMTGSYNQMNYRQNIPQQGNTVPPQNYNGNQPNKKTKTKQTNKKGKSNVGLIVAAVILGILVIALGVVCFLVWNGTISLPFIDTDTAVVSEESEEAETESSSSEESVVEIDADELFAEEDALIETGKSQITVDADIVNGMNSLTTAIDQAVAKAEEAGDAGIAADRVTDAYTSYITAVARHKDMLNASTLSGGIYGQIMMELEDAIALGDELADKGYTVDTSSLTSAKDEFDAAYKDKIITTFDEFTSRPAWSRTESWNLMSETADNMFDTNDLDDPIRLRYAYALSWWTQKQIETELTNGTITAKGAAIKIANLIDVMDYNPMMINYYITYMKEAKEDCKEVEDAYNDIVEQIAQTQGLTIGKDVDLEHFWYFNDFNTHPVDSTNGVTQENRQWIRERMSSVTFLEQ